MRKTLLAASSLASLVFGLVAPPPAVAADATHTVVGHPLTAPGLAQQTYLCAGSTAATPTLLERQGGTAGASALGWQMTPAGTTVGPRAILAGDPTTLNRFEIDVLAPTGTTGWAHVYFEDNGDGDDFSQNDGWIPLTIPASGSWQHLDLSQLTYKWDWWVDSVYQGQYNNTIQGFAGDSGFIANATFDVVLGCGAEQFYLDRLMIGHSVNSVAYDFEAKPVVPPPCHPGHVTPECPGPVVEHHVAHLEWSTDGKAVQDGTSVTIRYGQGVWLLGHGHVHAASGNIWYSGLGTLSAERTTASPSTAFRGAFTPTQYAAIKVAPTETTIYRFTADAHEGHPATVSEPVTVHVQSKVRARLLDRHLIEGQKLAVKGKVAPEVKGVKVTLQRKVGRRWSSITTSRTGGGGKFTLATQARTPGSWKLRVKVATTSTNVGTLTGSATVKVDRYVPPRKHQAPPTPAVDHTPELAAPVVTPDPPKVTATAPTPPDRPTPTGRKAAVAGGMASSGGVTARAGKG